MRNLTLLNKALLCKWSWCFAMEGEAFWKQVICGKYGEEEGRWRSCEVRERFRVGLWKAIRREWVVMVGYMTFFVRNGRWVNFGRISGVATILCAPLFPPYLL